MTKSSISIGLVLLLFSAMILLSAMSSVTKVRAQLEWEVTATEVIVRTPEFEIHVSKRGGIVAYYLGGAQVLGETSLAFWGPGWSGFWQTTGEGEITKEPNIEQFEGGVKITTYCRWDIPKGLYFDFITVHRIYESGAVVISYLVKTWEASDFAGAAIFVRYPCDVFKGRYFAAFKGGNLVFEVEKLPEEHEPGSGFWRIQSGVFSVAYISAPGGAINVILAYITPSEIDTELSDEREWGGNEYATKGWIQDLVPKTAGGEANFTWIIFPHTRGGEFNKRAVEIMQLQASAYSYVAKVERIARSAAAKENLAKAKALLPKVLEAICRADLDTAKRYADEAYNYARAAFTIELRRASTLYIIIPLVVCVVVLGWAIRRWARSWKAERIEG